MFRTSLVWILHCVCIGALCNEYSLSCVDIIYVGHRFVIRYFKQLKTLPLTLWCMHVQGGPKINDILLTTAPCTAKFYKHVPRCHQFFLWLTRIPAIIFKIVSQMSIFWHKFVNIDGLQHIVSRKSQIYKSHMSHYLDRQHLCFLALARTIIIDKITIFWNDANKTSTSVE